ncbi:MAG: hypothetical protein RL340_170, partial [Gemmatimonadota bacterium]
MRPEAPSASVAGAVSPRPAIGRLLGMRPLAVLRAAALLACLGLGAP